MGFARTAKEIALRAKIDRLNGSHPDTPEGRRQRDEDVKEAHQDLDLLKEEDEED